MKNGQKLEKTSACKQTFSDLRGESRLTSVTLVTPSTVIILGLKTSLLRAFWLQHPCRTTFQWDSGKNPAETAFLSPSQWSLEFNKSRGSSFSTPGILSCSQLFSCQLSKSLFPDHSEVTHIPPAARLGIPHHRWRCPTNWSHGAAWAQHIPNPAWGQVHIPTAQRWVTNQRRDCIQLFRALQELRHFT